MAFFAASLASGSSGNSYYFQSSAGAVLIDAGLTGRELVKNIFAAGGDPVRVRGIIVTHDHGDHVSSAGVLHRRHGWKLWMTAGTREAAADRLGKIEAEMVRPGAGLSAAGFIFEFTATPHDGTEPVAVAAETTGRRGGVFTDLGHVFDGLGDLLANLDFVFLESNYDADLLAANQKYPPFLKARIRGEGGHLSNTEASTLIRNLPGERLRRVVLSHLSQENNRPELARNCFLTGASERIRDSGMRVGVAPRHEPLPLFEV
ncbi:MAG: MBL fold metallo-hydrolase [Planctomycetes bacterium]|nr:MBL fold metallo-hydrolase [Planctomycetota bacterium]